MFTDNFAVDQLADFCRTLEIPFASKPVNIAGAISKGRKEPCFTCAFFRRGAVNRQAQQAGYNKVAYAHHNDDAVETLLLGLLYAGQLKTFAPKTFLSRTKLTVIRPLIYFREAELRAAVPLHGFTPLPNPCPFDGQTKRQEIKNLLTELGKNNPSLYANLAGAIRLDKTAVELWPPPLPRNNLKQKHAAFWRLRDN